jgi:hypothetical protein
MGLRKITAQVAQSLHKNTARGYQQMPSVLLAQLE